jgi:hypothetical protein
LYTLSVFVKMADNSKPVPTSDSTGATYDLGLVANGATIRIGNILATSNGRYVVDPTPISNVWRVSAQWVPSTSSTGNFGVVRQAAYSGKGFTVTGFQLTEGPLGPYIPAWGAQRVLGTMAESVSADRGDTSQTITVGVDNQIQRWATTLTANRTVTLSTTGAANGDSFRVVRTGLGAFTLDVGGLKTIPSGTAAFVDVTYDGSAWRLTGYGVL